MGTRSRRNAIRVLGTVWLVCLGAAAPVEGVDQAPIRIVYVNHVEVESVIEYTPPLVDGGVYTATAANYAFTSGQIGWEIAQAEAVGARISFHMSGAFAERAVAAGDQALWAQHLVTGHTVGVHFHKFLRGPAPFQWISSSVPAPIEVAQAWQDNHDLAAALVGAAALWIGESHYSCPPCWNDLGYSLRATERMALLPAGQHIVWLVERDPQGVVVYPHLPQIGNAGWHGPPPNQIYFDLRLEQLQKEFLMLYLEWLERERLNLEPQVWAWGWANHGGPTTAQHAAEIEQILGWLHDNFVGSISPRGNLIAEFVGDHELVGIYEAYEAGGGVPLPPPAANVNDRFPFMAHALADAGVSADLTGDLGVAGVRLFELERQPPQGLPLGSPPRVYLLFREIDGSDIVDLSEVLAAQGIEADTLTLIDVVGGGRSAVDPSSLVVGPTPLVLEPDYSAWFAGSPFGFHPAVVGAPGYPDSGFVDAETIGVRWHRPPVYSYWFLIQPDLGSPSYNWTLPDQQYGTVPPGMRILANIAPDHPMQPHGYMLPGSFVPIDVDQYATFVRATVERYDGDGIDDMPGLFNPVRHWQVGNEPNNELTTGFALLQQITYLAIKEACPECTVMIGGVAGFPDDYVSFFDVRYAPILEELGGQYVDVFDFHWYGMAGGDYRLADSITGEDVLEHLQSTLTAAGFAPDLPIWITEMGTYSGQPLGPFPAQSERQHAGDLFKRFIYTLGRGVEKIFPAFGLIEGFIHNDGYFDHTGLIYDGSGSGDLGLGVKKLGYYTYRKMTELLEGAEWTTATLLHDGTGSDHLYLTSVVKDGAPLYIAWWDYFDEPGYTPGDTKVMTLTGLSDGEVVVTAVVPGFATGQQVVDYATAFAVSTETVAGGTVTITLGEDPVVVAQQAAGGAPPFRRGDANQDGLLDIADAIIGLAFLFGGEPVGCELAIDSNDDNAADISDAVYTLAFLFGAGPVIPEPFPACGLDPTPGSLLTCESFLSCP